MSNHRSKPYVPYSRLSDQANAWGGRTVELVRSGIMCNHFTDEGDYVVEGGSPRRTSEGERGVVINVTDAGFAGLLFKIELSSGESMQAYRTDVRLV